MVKVKCCGCDEYGESYVSDIELKEFSIDAILEYWGWNELDNVDDICNDFIKKDDGVIYYSSNDEHYILIG